MNIANEKQITEALQFYCSTRQDASSTQWTDWVGKTFRRAVINGELQGIVTYAKLVVADDVLAFEDPIAHATYLFDVGNTLLAQLLQDSTLIGKVRAGEDVHVCVSFLFAARLTAADSEQQDQYKFIISAAVEELLEHWYDFISSRLVFKSGKRIAYSVPQIKKSAAIWTLQNATRNESEKQQQASLAILNNTQHCVPVGEPLLIEEAAYRLFRLETKEAHDAEGDIMRNCIGSANYWQRATCEIFSVRRVDAQRTNNIPLMSVEARATGEPAKYTIAQAKKRFNASPSANDWQIFVALANASPLSWSLQAHQMQPDVPADHIQFVPVTYQHGDWTHHTTAVHTVDTVAQMLASVGTTGAVCVVQETGEIYTWRPGQGWIQIVASAEATFSPEEFQHQLNIAIHEAARALMFEVMDDVTRATIRESVEVHLRQQWPGVHFQVICVHDPLAYGERVQARVALDNGQVYECTVMMNHPGQFRR